MVERIVDSSLRFRFLLAVVAGAVLLFGVIELRKASVDVLPEFQAPYIEVQTESLGLSAAEVESLVSLNIEELLNGTPWLQSIRSRSVPGLSSVVLVFEPGTDIMKARQLVQERLSLAYMLPNVSSAPVLMQPLSATSRVMMVGLSSQDVSPIEMSVLARWNLRPALMSVPGVANVSIWGQRRRQLQVQVDPAWLRAQGVTLDQVVRTTGDALWVSPLSYLNASTPGTGGWIDTPQQRLTVRHVLPISSAEDLAQVAVVDSQPLRLVDVAEVVEGHQPLIGDAMVDDGPGLLLVVEKLPGANTLEVTRLVEEKLRELQPGLTGIEVDSTIFRPASFIEISLKNLARSVLAAFLLVVLAVFAFLRGWRTLLMAIVTIPLAFVAAAFALDLGGTTMNAMVLAGFIVALAAVIDDLVVDEADRTRRLRRSLQSGGDGSEDILSEQVVRDGAVAVRGTMTFGVLITLALVTPAFFLEGVTGALYRPVALAYVLVVVASAVIGMSFRPALAAIMLPKEPSVPGRSPLAVWAEKGHAWVLSRTIKRIGVMAIVCGAIGVAGLAGLPFLHQGSIVPSFRETELLIDWEAAPGTSRPEMTRVVDLVRKEVPTITGVRNFGAHVGRAVMGDEIVGINSAELWVGVDPEVEYDATVADVTELIESYPGLTYDVRTYLDEVSSQALTGSSYPIVVRVYGPDLGVLREKAEEVRAALADIKGIEKLETESGIEEPYVEIEVDLDKADDFGVKPGDVRRAAATIVSGIGVGSLFEDQKVFDVVVWGTPDSRHSVSSIDEVLVDTPGGGYVRLGDVAEVRLASTLMAIDRDAVSRRIDVGIDVSGRDLGAVAGDVEEALALVDFPTEYHAELLGEYADRQAAQRRLLLVGAVVLVGIFLLFQAAFDSWRRAALALLTLPLSVVGGIWFLIAFDGGELSLGAIAGFIVLFGLAARNSVSQMCRFSGLERGDEDLSGIDLALRGSGDRSLPVMLTAVAVALAFSPFLVFAELPGHEILAPMALVVIGGLITSMIVQMLVVPAFYARLMREVAEEG